MKGHTGEILAIIPARGGSKGIPRKNLALLGGEPLIVHSIEQALAARSVTRVVVSTDDPDIAETALSCGADVINRPAGLADDHATSESALLHALDALAKAEDYEPDLVVFLQATSPVRTPGDIDAAVTLLRDRQADSLFSAGPLHGFVWRRVEGEWTSLDYDYHARPRRQDHPESVIENGSIYVFNPRILRRTNNRLGGRIVAYRMPAERSVQIDEPGDLEVAECLLALLPKRPSNERLRRIRLLALDFDGVFTDDRVLVDQEAGEAVFCHRGDGHGIALAKEAGIDVVVVSREVNPVVSARCEKLGIECHQNVLEKQKHLSELAERMQLSPSEVAFVGNDVPDVEALKWAGVAVAVADAHENVRRVANWITRRSGGRGAIREIIDAILIARASR